MTKPWKKIDQFYSELPVGVPAFDSMRSLVKQIVGSAYENGIYAWTSMHDLCIVQNEVEYPYNGPYLRISPQQNGNVEFCYVDTYIKNKQWRRVVSGEKSFDRLCRFFNELHWFSPMK